MVLAVILVVAGSLYLYIPGQVQTEAYAKSDQLASGIDPRLVTGNTGFAIDLLRELRAEDPGKNVFFSPLSISTTLTMTLDGARGTTREAMVATLGLGEMTQAEVDAAYHDLLASLTGADAGVTLSTANSVWVDSAFQPSVNKTFSDDLGSYYAADFYTRKFSDPATVADINNWVSGKTSGRINRLIDKLYPEDVMALLNAIYFKGDWKEPFDASKTAKGIFRLDLGANITVNMMYAKYTDLKYRYYDGDGFQVARLPYGRDKIAMYVFLPDTNSSLTAMLERLDVATLDDVFSNQVPRLLVLSLPRFNVEYGIKELNAALTNLGMGVAFDTSKANFTGISKGGGLSIDFVNHKAMIDVNEEGTEAAASTVVVIQTSSSIPIPFYIDRPFLFMIRDDRSGSILFMGAITDPTQVTSP